MASQDLQKELQCSLCVSTIIEPKLVDCFHMFCKLCIKRNAEVDRQHHILKCPQCDSKTLLQDLNDVEDLQNSPVHSRILNVFEFVENQKNCSVSSSHPEAVWQCVDCNKSLCDDCLRNHSEFTKDHQVVSLSDLKKEDIDKLFKRGTVCKYHNNQNVELYCKDCEALICMTCYKELEHNKHDIIELWDMIAIETDALSKNLADIKKMTADEVEKKQQEEIAQRIKRDGEKAKQQVKKLTDDLVQTLRNSERELLNQIQQSVTKAERNLRIISHPSQVQEYIKYFMENGTASEMIETRHHKSSQNLTYDPFNKTISGIEFKSNEELCKQVKDGLGHVGLLNNKADLKMSSIKVVPSDLEAMNKAKLVVELKTSEGEVTQEPVENIAIQFTPEDDVKVEEIQMTEDGEITVDFVPRVPGQLTADINVLGNPLCNSPLVMLVKPQLIMTAPSRLIHSLNTGSKQFEGIAVTRSNSKIAVGDCTSHCVRVFSMKGDLLLTYGSEGSGQGQLNDPCGLAFLTDRDLVITDTFNHRICIVNTATGQLIRSFGCFGNNNGQFKYPWDVHVDDDDNIIVCDNYNSRLQIFTKDGVYLRQFSVPGCPNSVVTHNGMFYVSSDSGVHVMEMKDNQSLSVVTSIGGDDNTDGQLQDVWGLAVVNDNNLLLCDYDARLIYKYTLDGRYVGQSTRLDHGLCYIAVLNDGRVIYTTYGGGVVFLNN